MSHDKLKCIEQVLASIFPQRRVEQIIPLTGGLINTNLKVTFATGEAPVVLRLYRGTAETCLKEVEVLRLVRPNVPVPEVLHAEPNGIDGSRPFVLLEFVNGLTFQQLKRTNNVEAIHQAAASVGEVLAVIGRHTFDKPGRLITDTGQLSVGAPYIDGADPVPRILDTFLDNEELQRRIGPELIEKLHEYIWSWAPRLPDLTTDSFLVHSDYGNRNILVNESNGRWEVAAILDWEFAFSGSPLLDVGHFLRYENTDAPLREPYFSRAYVNNGGILPDNWRDVVRVIDLTALVEILTHPDLPQDIVSEVLGLIESTLKQTKCK